MGDLAALDKGLFIILKPSSSLYYEVAEVCGRNLGDASIEEANYNYKYLLEYDDGCKFSPLKEKVVLDYVLLVLFNCFIICKGINPQVHSSLSDVINGYFESKDSLWDEGDSDETFQSSDSEEDSYCDDPSDVKKMLADMEVITNCFIKLS